MKVILLADVKNVGKKGEVVDVSDGYARNYLFRNKLALAASSKSMEVLEDQKQHARDEETKNKENALKLKEQLAQITLVFEVKTGEKGKVFGSISTKQVAEELNKKHNIAIDKRKMKAESLSELGVSKVMIDLHRDVEGFVTVHLKAKN
jgi:large subunit ribosomal protein L9